MLALAAGGFLRMAPVSIGAAQKDGDPYTLYMYGKPADSDPEGVYRSTDCGKSWILCPAFWTWCARVRAKISGTPERPRLCVYRSTKHIYAQLIDDVNGVTLASASSMDKAFEGVGGNAEGARKVGEMIAKRALEKDITDVVFDRGGYLYHGRVKELADSARENGLKF